MGGRSALLSLLAISRVLLTPYISRISPFTSCVYIAGAIPNVSRFHSRRFLRKKNTQEKALGTFFPAALKPGLCVDAA